MCPFYLSDIWYENERVLLLFGWMLRAHCVLVLSVCVVPSFPSWLHEDRTAFLSLLHHHQSTCLPDTRNLLCSNILSVNLAVIQTGFYCRKEIPARPLALNPGSPSSLSLPLNSLNHQPLPFASQTLLECSGLWTQTKPSPTHQPLIQIYLSSLLGSDSET